MKTALPITLLALGVLLLVLSSLWVRIDKPTNLWTEDDAAILKNLSEEVVKHYYALSPEQLAEVESPERDPSLNPTPYEKAVAARNKHRAKRDLAMTRPKRITALLRWSGLASLAAGAVAFYAFKK